MKTYTKNFNTRVTPQSEAIPGSTQVPNSAGGFAWAVDDWVRLNRFLILGTEGGSYYAGERKLTKDNGATVLRAVKADGNRAVETIAMISESGRAPKNDPALFALAVAAGLGDEDTRRAAFAALPRVARIGTHLFKFAEALQGFRGWGRMARAGIANWYETKTAEQLALQAVKYQQREGWSHADLLRLSHPDAPTAEHRVLYDWMTPGKALDGKTLSDLIDNPNLKTLVGFEILKGAKTTDEVVKTVLEYKLPREAVEGANTEWLKEPKVWEALLPSMPLEAMIRNLARMTTIGMLKPMSTTAATIVARLADQERIHKSRLHPIKVLSAMMTYQQGHGVRSLERSDANTWTPVQAVVDALNDAFYLSFENVVPTGKRTLLALDVSSSMNGGVIAGVPGLTPRMGSAAMAMVTARTEPNHVVMAFATTFKKFDVSPKERLDDIVAKADRTGFGGTDCSLPMIYAQKNDLDVDTFVVYTDNETWAGKMHPAQALKQYREKRGIPARLVVVGMVANEFSIADPNDAGMLDVVGFDTAAPQLISDFSKGNV